MSFNGLRQGMLSVWTVLRTSNNTHEYTPYETFKYCLCFGNRLTAQGFIWDCIQNCKWHSAIVISLHFFVAGRRRAHVRPKGSIACPNDTRVDIIFSYRGEHSSANNITLCIHYGVWKKNRNALNGLAEVGLFFFFFTILYRLLQCISLPQLYIHTRAINTYLSSCSFLYCFYVHSNSQYENAIQASRESLPQ